MFSWIFLKIIAQDLKPVGQTDILTVVPDENLPQQRFLHQLARIQRSWICEKALHEQTDELCVQLQFVLRVVNHQILCQCKPYHRQTHSHQRHQYDGKQLQRQPRKKAIEILMLIVFTEEYLVLCSSDLKFLLYISHNHLFMIHTLLSLTFPNNFEASVCMYADKQSRQKSQKTLKKCFLLTTCRFISVASLHYQYQKELFLFNKCPQKCARVKELDFASKLHIILYIALEF